MGSSLLVLAACQGSGGERPGSLASSGETGSTTLPLEPFDVCDGSNDVRLRWQLYGGAHVSTWSPLFFDQGDLYLMIDGTCRFYAYDGLGQPLEEWNPVVTGILDTAAMDDLAQDLDIARWPTGGGYVSLENTDPSACPGMEPTLLLITLGDTQAGCGCCAPESFDLFTRGLDAVQAITPTGEPYLSPILDAMVLPGDSSYYYEYPRGPPEWSIAWEAAEPIETFLTSPYLGGGDYSAGVRVSDEDLPWFQQVMTDFQARDTDVWPWGQDAIWVVDYPGISDYPEWELYIHPEVP